jgi:hypothetical protein
MPDLAIRSRGLLIFVEQSVDEGLLEQAQSTECFEEADCAVRILQKTLLKEDGFRHSQLMLMGVFDSSFAEVSQIEDQDERDRRFQEELGKIRFAKTLFERE